MIDHPALRYAGGKWRIAEWVISHFPPHEHYVEPYGGAASVLLNKEPSRLETYNDLNGDVTNFFAVLRDRCDELVSRLELTPYAKAEHELAHTPTDDPMERARRFYVRCWQSHTAKTSRSTGWRFMRTLKDRSKAPVHDWANIDNLLAVASRFHGVQIENRPGLFVLGAYDTANTLFYVDPPYTQGDRFDRSLYKHEMTDADHVELATTLHGLQGMVILSGYRSDLYQELYGAWHSVEMKARTNSPYGKTRMEVLWMNAACFEHGRQLELMTRTQETGS